KGIMKHLDTITIGWGNALPPIGWGSTSRCAAWHMKEIAGCRVDPPSHAKHACDTVYGMCALTQ
ncbi:hypothetical protein, partial [Rhizobium ruizarguesonis]|uniref:hypothetical protein n=1 Tax=Rhizobium ruizarguesonis TaxID=2081791 RepID=UPI001A7EB20C